MSREQQGQQSIEAAQAILSETFSRPMRLGVGEPLGGSNRSHVARCPVLDAHGEIPETVVVKQALPQGQESYNPDSGSGPAMRLFNEWAALQFLGECFGDDSPVPRFYGGDREAGVIVMQDLGEGEGLDKLLLGSNAAAAESAMVELFQVIGRMHAVSAGKAKRYSQLRAVLGPHAPGFVSDVADYAKSIESTLNSLGLGIPATLDAEIESCVQMALDPGPFGALLHCDPCPDNCLLLPGGMKLLDFEFAQFGLALWDGAYARIHFPTCWCVNRIPDPIVERVEAAYRHELMKGCPQAGDDMAFGRAVVAACASALFLTLSWTMPEILQGDSLWGIATKRQRVLVRLDAFAKASRQWGRFPALGASAQQIAIRLRDVWQQEIEDMPPYPAFQLVS